MGHRPRCDRCCRLHSLQHQTWLNFGDFLQPSPPPGCPLGRLLWLLGFLASGASNANVLASGFGSATPPEFNCQTNRHLSFTLLSLTDTRYTFRLGVVFALYRQRGVPHPKAELDISRKAEVSDCKRTQQYELVRSPPPCAP